MRKGGTYLALGDSTTWTIPSESTATGYSLYSYRACKAISENYAPIRHLNKGIGGARSTHIAERIGHFITGVEFDLVTIGLGMNDCNSGGGSGQTVLSTFQANMEKIVDEIKIVRPDADIILCKIMPTNDPNRSPYRNDYNNIIQTVATAKGTLVADFSNAYSDFATYAPDGIHPNTVGHGLIFDILWPVIQQTNFVQRLV